MDIAAALRAFVRTVERGSVTGAARDLAISQPAVTKHLRNLERHVGARLIERSSRAFRPTAQGISLFETARTALATIDAALEGVRQDTNGIDGNFRIFAPSCIGAEHVHPLLMAFQEEHPGVSADLVLDNRRVDLILENFDLAIQYGKPEDQELIIRKLGHARRILVAAPDYLERTGPIDTLERLSESPIVATTTVLSQRNCLSLRRGDVRVELPVRPLLKTNNAQVIVNSLVAGQGPGPVQHILVAAALADGRLVRILPDYEVQPTEVYATYPSARFMRPVVRAFLDFIVPKLRAVDGID